MVEEHWPGTDEDIADCEFRCSIAAKALADIDPKDFGRFFENFHQLRNVMETLQRSRQCKLARLEREGKKEVSYNLGN